MVFLRHLPVAWLLVHFPVIVSQQAPAQCKDPLFETHWSGKNDIQTLLDFPGVKTNLKLCHHYNQKASCCHQLFETEQQKFFDFWKRRFQEKLLRLAAHRDSVLTIARGLNEEPQVDREQLEVVLDRYAEVLGGKHQSACFSTLMMYVAGMVCFSCKPDWFHYTLMDEKLPSLPRVGRVNVAESVCIDLWSACRHFGESAKALKSAVQDSKVAQAAPLSFESLDMFMDLQQLCEWMQEEVALHPFKLLTREDEDVPSGLDALAKVVQMSTQEAARSTSVAPGTVYRRLDSDADGQDLNVLEEGRQSAFDLFWQSPVGDSSTALQRLPSVTLAVASLLASALG